MKQYSFISLVLLAVFMLAALPTQLWHHHHIPHHQDTDLKDGLVWSDEECPICSFHIAPYLSVSHEVTSVGINLTRLIGVELKLEYYPPAGTRFSSRAPPLA